MTFTTEQLEHEEVLVQRIEQALAERQYEEAWRVYDQFETFYPQEAEAFAEELPLAHQVAINFTDPDTIHERE